MLILQEDLDHLPHVSPQWVFPSSVLLLRVHPAELLPPSQLRDKDFSLKNWELFGVTVRWTEWNRAKILENEKLSTWALITKVKKVSTVNIEFSKVCVCLSLQQRNFLLFCFHYQWDHKRELLLKPSPPFVSVCFLLFYIILVVVPASPCTTQVWSFSCFIPSCYPVKHQGEADCMKWEFKHVINE